jgi:3-isopropylmalate/(R)-2-methylmalate dehydratase small subunit
MQSFSTLKSPAVKILVDDIDTDQIIPARFLKTTNKLGLATHLFSNWRYHEDGSANESFALNQEAMQGRGILLAGDNFGCGSSREHAPWALSSWGFQVIISTSFADIFRSNALKNGLLLIEVSAEQHQRLVDAELDAEIHVDLQAQTWQLDKEEVVAFPIDAFSKRCLLDGLDQLGYLQSFDERITEYEKGR